MYNGFLGGIGQGLQAFTSAYQTALNYQLEKSKAAALTDYQQKMADAAQQNSTAASAQAYTDQLNKMGSEIAFPNAAKLRMNLPTPPPAEGGMNQDNIATGTPPSLGPEPQGLVNPGKPGLLPAGMVGPPTPPQPTQADRTNFENSPAFVGPHLPITGQPLSSAQAKLPSQLPAQGSPGSLPIGPNPFAPIKGLYGIFKPGIYPTEQERQIALGNMKIVSDKNLESPKTGMTYALNRQTLQPEVVSVGGPLEPQAAQEAKNKQLEGQNLQFGARSTNQAVINDYKESAAFQTAQKSAVPMNAVVKILNQKNPTPEQIQNAMRNVVSVQTGVSDQRALDDLMNSPAIVDKVNNIVARIKAGVPAKEVIYGMAKSAIDQHISNTEIMMLKQQNAAAEMAARGGDASDPGLALDPGAMSAYKGAMKLQGQLPKGYVAPNQRPNSGVRNAWGILPWDAHASGPMSAPKGSPPLGSDGKPMSFQQFQQWKKSNGK